MKGVCQDLLAGRMHYAGQTEDWEPCLMLGARLEEVLQGSYPGRVIEAEDWADGGFAATPETHLTLRFGSLDQSLPGTD